MCVALWVAGNLAGTGAHGLLLLSRPIGTRGQGTKVQYIFSLDCIKKYSPRASFPILSSSAGKDFNTVNPSLSTGKDFLIHSLKKNWLWENVRPPPKLRRLGNPSPLPSRFPSTLKISLGLRPREISCFRSSATAEESMTWNAFWTRKWDRLDCFFPLISTKTPDW